MWSKLFKKDVWCRRIYEQGTTPFADEERRAVPPNFPAPMAGIELPPRLACHRCNAVRRSSKRSAAAGHGKKRPQATPTRRMSVVVRRSLGVHANRTFELISRRVQYPYTLFPLQVFICLYQGCTQSIRL